ncbi:MFS transporter [Bacillus salitolerans]|uniref:MFS transporter n=1 Tax=Bacillus salitolerans TaxID=1437434 RepID=A0ABW4LVM3_9BACI
MNRSFYAVLVSQTATNLGFALYTMVVVLHLYNKSGSTTIAATVTLISIIFRMISHIMLPMISDRFKLPKLLLFSQTVQFILLIVLYVLFTQVDTSVHIGIIFMLLGLISFFNGFFTPIKSTLVRSIVPVDGRVKANSLLSSVDQTFLFAGWTFGGILLAIAGIHTTLFISIGLCVLTIVCLLLIKMNNEQHEIQPNEAFMSRLTVGWKYLFKHKGLRILVFMDLIEAWVGTIWIGAVTLTYVQDALGKGETWWGYINGGYYLGTILGGILIIRFNSYLKGRLTIAMLVGSMTFGILTFIYGFISVPIIALLLVLLMGPSYQLRDIAQETMYQNSVDENTLTKILSAKSTLIQLIFIFSILGIGALTDLIGVRLVYILSGAFLICSSLFGLVYLHFKRVGPSMENEQSESML